MLVTWDWLWPELRSLGSGARSGANGLPTARARPSPIRPNISLCVFRTRARCAARSAIVRLVLRLTLRSLRNRSHGLCEPTPERRLGAALYLEDARRRGRFFHEGADAMVGLALLVASALHVDGEEAEPGEPPEGVVVPIPPIDMSCFSERGHQVVQVGHALVCRCCASFSPRLRVSPKCKLRSVCTGFSREKRLKKAQLAALAKVLSGFHPKTGASLVSPPHPASSSSAPPPLPPPPQEVQGESPPPTVG